MLQVVRTFLVEFILLAIIAGLYLLNLGIFPLESGSEIFDIEIAREAIVAGHWIVPHFDAAAISEKAPLMGWLNAIAMALFGVKVWSARLVSMGLALANIALTYMLSLSIFKSRSKAIISALILASSWGFFKLSHYASSDILSTALILLFFLSLQQWLPLSGRRKSVRGETLQLSVLFGLLLGALFLAQGLYGVLLPVVALLIYLGRQGTIGNLETLEWKPLLLCFAGLTLPWLLTACILQGSAEPLTHLLVFPFWSPDGDLFTMAWDPLFHLKTFWLRLLPWIFFIAALLIDREPVRNQREQSRDMAMLLLFWFVAGFILISLPGWQEETDILMILPPLAILGGLYAGHYAENNALSDTYRWTMDLALVCLMLGAITTAMLYFQILPDTYALEFWNLPGLAMFSTEVKDMQLEFPLWKLWLIPGPLILLAGGVALYIFRTSEKPQAVAMTLGFTFLTFFLFIKGIYLPIVHRPVVQQLAQSIGASLPRAAKSPTLKTPHETHVVIYDPSRDLSSALFYVKSSLLPVQLQTSEDIAPLEQVLLERTAEPEQTTYGLIKDTDYYRLSPSVRQYLRIRRSNWLWDVEQRAEFYKALRSMETNFTEMTYHVLLFEVVPQATVEETEDPALQPENLEEPIDTPFQPTRMPTEI